MPAIGMAPAQVLGDQRGRDAPDQPTMLTVDMAFRINAYGDYATANALGVITYLISAGAAILYLQHGMAKESAP